MHTSVITFLHAATMTGSTAADLFVLRWRFTLAQALPWVVLCSCVAVGGWVAGDLPLIVVGILGALLTVSALRRRQRRRRLRVDSDGLVFERNDYELAVPWSSLRRLTRARVGLVPVWVAVFDHGVVRPRSGAAMVPTGLEQRVIDCGADQRGQISVVGDPFEGPFGEWLANVRPDLMPAG